MGVLFLSLYQGYATEATNLLFGSIVGVSDRQLAGARRRRRRSSSAGIAAAYRPLLFSSIDPEVAEARGVPVRALSVLTFLLLALTTAEAIQVVGVLLVLTLVITPAAAAQRLTANPATAILLSIVIALVATEGGILLSLAAAVADELLHQLDLVRRLPGRPRGRVAEVERARACGTMRAMSTVRITRFTPPRPQAGVAARARS